jgi:hypothetical protein
MQNVRGIFSDQTMVTHYQILCFCLLFGQHKPTLLAEV